MTMSNAQRVGDALALLSRGLRPFVERELKAAYGDDWLATVQAPTHGSPTAHLRAPTPGDAQWLLKTMWSQWNEVFRRKLGQEERTLVSELMTARNRWAHQEPFSTDQAYRALDSIQLLLTAISAEEAPELDEQKHQLLQIRTAEYSRRKSRQVAATLFEDASAEGLAPWRDVVTPHPDVASGNYQQAEFAANLQQVYEGGAASEYQDPVEFFRRTFLTRGLQRLLTQAIERLGGRGGAPVVDLQTNFGGGKTHSLLALYHIAGGTPANQLAGVDTLLKDAGISELPRANRAVLVGTAISPGTVHERGSIGAHTLWGELAWQLGGADGYALVADADRTATNPGTALHELFRRYSPCLVLVDEWVAYARQLYGMYDLPAGSFDTHFTFAQALTEAAAAVPGTLLVISIPASDTAQTGHSAGESALNEPEVGTEAGQKALERLRSVIGRTESPWAPATAEEGFEIVRRRLFEPFDSRANRERETVAKVFRAFYAKYRSEFPADCGEGTYERRIVNAYPIHPELFDRLYNDWSTLPRFQRTRGVLRLMAQVIHELWESGDQSPLILPASVPLDDPLVSDELTRYLEEKWRPMVDAEIDGERSLPRRLDRENPSFGRIRACQRAARTVFIGSAATLKTPNKGIDDRRIKLGSVLPGEVPALIGDALRRMTEHSAFLYADSGRYWFDTQASVLQTARDRAAQYTDDQWHMELVSRLRQQRGRGEFAGVHIAPANDSDVGDEDRVRLVVLGPEHPHTSRTESTEARARALQILERHGSGPRRYRNMVVFLAPDRTRLEELEAAVRQYLAWKSIVEEREALGLSPHAERQAVQQRDAASQATDQRIPETYQWLLVPHQPEKDNADVVVTETRLTGQGTLAERASRRMISDCDLYAQFAGALLRMELDRVPLWPPDADFVNLKRVWEYFAQYLYLPRLRDAQVLLESVRNGIASMSWMTDTFAYAQSVDKDGRFVDPCFGRHADTSIQLNDESVLVKPAAMQRQVEGDAAAEREFNDRGGLFTPPGEQPPLGGDGLRDGSSSGEGVGLPAGRGATAAPNEVNEPRVLRHFYGVVDLDPTRLNRQVPEIVEHVVEHLTRLAGATVRVKLDIDADVPGGVPPKTVMDVTENARTLKFSDFGFEEE
jgi:predicted AAA+ superfamily ATPase